MDRMISNIVQFLILETPLSCGVSESHSLLDNFKNLGSSIYNLIRLRYHNTLFSLFFNFAFEFFKPLIDSDLCFIKYM